MSEEMAVNVIKEGYMGKKMKHNILNKVQQRYFKLLDYELLYWKKKEQADAGEEPLAYIPLKAYKLEVPHGKMASKHAFRLSVMGNQEELLSLGKNPSSESKDDEDKIDQAKYVLECATAEEKVEWENAIRDQMWKACTKDNKIFKQRKLTGFAPPSLTRDLAPLQRTIEE